MERRDILNALLAIMGSALVYFFIKLWRARRFFTRLQKQGLPMLPHSFAAGHLIGFKSVVNQLPHNAHKAYAFCAISRFFEGRGAYYIDLWPFSEPFLIVTSPTLANQAVQTTQLALEKPDALRQWQLSLTGGISMFDAHPEHWKELRDLFSPGFSTGHLMTLVPAIVREALVYRETLREHAHRGDMFFLDPVTARYIMDIIGQVTLNAKLNAQKGWSPLADAMINQVKWKMANQESDPLQWLNPIRPIVEWYNGRQMDAYINRELDKRFEVYKTGSIQAEKRSQFNSIIDLALQDYVADPVKSFSGRLDKKFRMMTLRNIRMFLFVGHDSSSSTICYCYHLLSTHRDALARIRAEHDALFGTDPASAPAALSADPYLLNRLPYTTAVIKETMRLFPAASSIRQGLPGVDLVDDDGTRYPTAGAMVWIQHIEMQRSARYWPRADAFLPDRWLVGSDHPLYPPPCGAWRPFEFGPRNCIGQPLVMTEIKTTLALTIREFDIVPMYDAFDAANPRKGPRAVDGEPVYQTEEGAAHPRDHYPCRVSLRSAT